jgi:hypothetical protein
MNSAKAKNLTFPPSLLRPLLLFAVIAALVFVIAGTANCGEVTINDINRALSAAEKTALMTLVEKQMRFHRTHFSFRPPVVLNIRLFKTEKEYVAYRDKNSTSPSNTGYYAGKKNEIVANKTVKSYFETLLHESQHALFRLTGTKAPKWLNEGLSQFFEESYEENGIVFVKAAGKKAAKVKKLLELNKLTPLRKLVSLSDKEWDSQFKEKDFKYYFECWSLIYFMMVDKQSRQRHDLVMILRDLKKGSKYSTLQAINRRYKGGISALERDWHEFIRSSNFKQKLRYQSY